MVIHDRPQDLKAQQEKRLELEGFVYLVDDVETLFVCIWFSRPIHYYYHLLIVCFFQLLDLSTRACKTVHPSFLHLFCWRFWWDAGFAPDSVAATFTTHHQPFALLGCLLCSSHSEDGKFGAPFGFFCACLEFVASIIQNWFFVDTDTVSLKVASLLLVRFRKIFFLWTAMPVNLHVYGAQGNILWWSSLNYKPKSLWFRRRRTPL